jgi:hypothetical protein
MVADATLARSLLGWQPRLSAPDPLVSGAVAWARRRHNRPAE